MLTLLSCFLCVRWVGWSCELWVPDAHNFHTRIAHTVCVVCWWSWWRLCTLNCVVLCFAPPLFRLPSFLILSMYSLLLRCVAVYSFLSWLKCSLSLCLVFLLCFRELLCFVASVCYVETVSCCHMFTVRTVVVICKSVLKYVKRISAVHLSYLLYFCLEEFIAWRYAYSTYGVL